MATPSAHKDCGKRRTFYRAESKRIYTHGFGREMQRMFKGWVDFSDKSST